jgi:hypothetical protein
VFLVLGVIGMVVGPSKDLQKDIPRNGLTDEQLLQITDDCIRHPASGVRHPDALRCK